MGDSTCDLFHVSMIALCAQPKHNQDSTEKLLIGQDCSRFWWCRHWGKEQDHGNFEVDKLKTKDKEW